MTVGASLTGCVTTPTSSPWAEIEIPTTKATQAVELPDRPLPETSNGNSATFSLASINALDAYMDVAENNTRLANEHARQLDANRIAMAEIVSAGKHQRRIADLRLEMIRDERRARFWDGLQYWVIIAALGFAVAD